MSFLANMFGGGNNAPQAPSESQSQQPTQQQATQQQQPQQPQQQSSQEQQSTQGQQSQSQNPLDSFRNLFDNKDTQDSNNPPSMRIPQSKLGEVAQTLDFSQSIPPEALARLQEGDFSALGEVLNSVARSAYTQALDHSTGVTEHYLNQRLKSERDSYSTQARVSTVESQLNVSDLDPVAQDMFRETARRVSTSNPTLSAKQVEEQTWSMMQAFSNQFNREGKQVAANKPKAIDYDQLGGWAD